MDTFTAETLGLENAMLDCLPMLIFFGLAILLPTVLKWILNAVLPKLCSHMPEWVGILLNSFSRPFVLMVRCFFICMIFYAVPFPFATDTYRRYVVLGFQLVCILLLGWGAWRAAPICRCLLRTAENRLDFSTGKTMTAFFANIYRFLVVLFLAIALLDSVGIPVTALLTGAGVAGLAVSLAAQSTLSNLIAGITLVLEHPFGIGDYVALGDYEGNVEDVSFRSTKLRCIDNSVITVENSKVCAEYIRNITDRKSRLWQTTIGVTYDASHETLEQLSAALTEMLEKNPKVVPGTAVVTLAEFGASSIDLQARAYVTTLTNPDFLVLKSTLNYAILDLVNQFDCSFAFPSTTVYLAGDEDKRPE